MHSAISVVSSCAEPLSLRVFLQGNGLKFQGSTFHRIQKDQFCQGGDFTRGDGRGGRSIYGPSFPDENFQLRHDGGGLLSMANAGPNTNGSQFFIIMRALPHLDNKHVVFGRVVLGFQTIRSANSVAVDSQLRPSSGHEVRVADAGELQPAEFEQLKAKAYGTAPSSSSKPASAAPWPGADTKPKGKSAAPWPSFGAKAKKSTTASSSPAAKNAGDKASTSGKSSTAPWPSFGAKAKKSTTAAPAPAAAASSPGAKSAGGSGKSSGSSTAPWPSFGATAKQATSSPAATSQPTSTMAAPSDGPFAGPSFAVAASAPAVASSASPATDTAASTPFGSGFGASPFLAKSRGDDGDGDGDDSGGDSDDGSVASGGALAPGLASAFAGASKSPGAAAFSSSPFASLDGNNGGSGGGGGFAWGGGGTSGGSGFNPFDTNVKVSNPFGSFAGASDGGNMGQASSGGGDGAGGSDAAAHQAALRRFYEATEPGKVSSVPTIWAKRGASVWGALKKKYGAARVSPFMEGLVVDNGRAHATRQVVNPECDNDEYEERPPNFAAGSSGFDAAAPASAATFASGSSPFAANPFATTGTPAPSPNSVMASPVTSSRGSTRNDMDEDDDDDGDGDDISDGSNASASDAVDSPVRGASDDTGGFGGGFSSFAQPTSGPSFNPFGGAAAAFSWGSAAPASSTTAAPAASAPIAASPFGVTSSSTASPFGAASSAGVATSSAFGASPFGGAPTTTSSAFGSAFGGGSPPATNPFAATASPFGSTAPPPAASGFGGFNGRSNQDDSDADDDDDAVDSSNEDDNDTAPGANGGSADASMWAPTSAGGFGFQGGDAINFNLNFS